MFIADGPQGEDLNTGYAISGYAGNLIEDMCNRVRLSRGEIYFTALVKDELVCKPIGGEAKKNAKNYLIQNKPQVERFRSILNNEISVLNPYLLIPIGELAFNYLTDLTGIRKFRGSVLPINGSTNLTKLYKVMPILGPYPYLYQDEKLKYISRIDFAKIHKYLNDAPPPDNLHRLWICKTASALRQFIERSYKAEGILVFDIETYMQIPTCISFCFDGFESVCVPLIDWSIDIDQRGLMLQLVAKLLNSPIAKVNQNIKYDWKILERWGLRVNNIIGDTMLAASTLYCEFPKNLGFLTSIYTDLPYFKDEGRRFDPTKHKREQFYLYNAKDSLATHQIHTQQVSEVKEQGVSYVYESLVKLMPIYRRMEDRGIRVNTDVRDELLIKYTNLFEIETLKLRKMIGAGSYVNPLSHVQMRKVVYDDLGYKPVRGVGTTKSGESKADEDSLQMLLANGESRSSYAADILRSIISCRKFHKVIEILELPLYPDGRLRCEFNLAGAETGRSTASETTDELIICVDNKLKVVNLGHSLQTIGKHGFEVEGETYGRDIRRMFIPTPGYRFVEIDLAGAEARVDAILAGITDLTYFNNPGIHKLTGSWCFDCLPSEIDKKALVPFGDNYINRYHVAKQVRHAGERNIKAAGLVTKLLWGFTVKQGDALLDRFHANEPNMRGVFHKEIRECVNKFRKLVSPNGRRRDFFDRINEHTYNEAISQLPQAIVSDQTKFEGILPTFTQLTYAHLLSEQHDGTLAEVPIGRELEYARVYVDNVQKPINFRTCSLPREVDLVIPAEVSIGDDWYNLEEVKI